MSTKLTIYIQELLKPAKTEIKDISEFFEKMLAIRLGPPVKINEEELLPETRRWMGAFQEFQDKDLKGGFKKHVARKYGNEKNPEKEALLHPFLDVSVLFYFLSDSGTNMLNTSSH